MAGTQATTGGRGEEQSALLAVVDGIVERMLRSPLMRRAPAQCSADEQVEQAALLGDLVQLRSLRQSLEAVSALRPEQVATYWPELAAILAPARRSTAAKPRPASAQSAQTLGGLYDALAQDPEVANPPDQPLAAVSAETAPAPSPADEAKPNSSPDLAHLLLEALTVQGRALNTTQMLAWLQERGTIVAREDVMNTLFGHEELFKRRGGGHWVVTSRDT